MTTQKRRNEMKVHEGLVPLMRQDRWVIWRWDDGKKVPFQARHPERRASVSNQTTWSTYEEALAAAPEGGVRVGGIGFVIGAGIGAFDLDDCRTKAGELDDWAVQLVADADSYTEVTPSRTGLRIIGRAYGGRVNTVRPMPTGKLEVYRGNCGRYITVTGWRLHGGGLRDIDSLIDAHSSGGDHGERSPSDDGWPEGGCASWLASLEDISAKRLIAKYAIDPWLMEVAPYRQRSDVIWKLALKLKEAGASRDEVGACVYASLAWRRKYGAGSANALANEVRRAFNKK
jgi:hypothetical protein